MTMCNCVVVPKSKSHWTKYLFQFSPQCCQALTLTLLRRKSEGEAKPEKEWRPSSLNQMALVAHTIILGIQVRSTP